MATNKRTFKVKKKLTKGQTNYRKWDEWENGDVLIGTFVSQGEDKYQKPNWEIKVEDAQFVDHKLGKKLLGKSLTLNSCGQLDKAMEKVEEGEMLQITYNGTAKINKGKFKGKDAHLVDVEIVVEEGSEDDVEENEEEENEETEENEDLDL